MQITLTIPRRRDPVSYGVLLTCLSGALWLSAGQFKAEAQTEAPPVILIVTPTLPTAAFAPVAEFPPIVDVPTAMSIPTAAPAVVELAAPTAAPQIVYQQVIVDVPAQPEIVYVDVPAQPAEVAPAYDPTLHPDEAQQALVEARSDLPTIQCPCGVEPSEAPPDARQYAWSKQRTR